MSKTVGDVLLSQPTRSASDSALCDELSLLFFFFGTVVLGVRYEAFTAVVVDNLAHVCHLGGGHYDE